MESETLQTLTNENEQLEAKLTKRNEQYIFDLKKSLRAANLTDEEITKALNEMLPILLKEQKNGRTARQIFGTVSEQLNAIVNKPVIEKKSTTASLMWFDNFLLLFGLLGIVSGGMALFVPRGTQTPTSYGLTALLVSSAIGGLIFYMMYLFFYQYDQPGADKSKKPKTWRSLLLISTTTVIWFLVFNGAALLPRGLNPVVDPLVLVVLAALALVLRFYLKKRFGIMSSLASAPRK